jgi:hypothetical protein
MKMMMELQKSMTSPQTPESSDSGQMKIKKMELKDMGVYDTYGPSYFPSASDYYASGRPLELSPGSEIRIRVPKLQVAKAPKYYRIENKAYVVANSDPTSLTLFATLASAKDAVEFVKRNNI